VPPHSVKIVIAEDFLQRGEGRLAGATVRGEILDYFSCESELPGERLDTGR